MARSPLLNTFGATASGNIASFAAVVLIGFRRTGTAEHRHRADQQAQRPNRAAVGIHAVSGGHHLLLAFASQSPNGLSERNIRRTLPALLR